MANRVTSQAVLVSQAAATKNQELEKIALFNSDGTPAGLGSVAAPLVTATAIGTAAKTTTSAEPLANSFVAIKYTNGNTADSATVAFAGGSARAIKLGGTASTGAKHTLAANGVGVYFFDGTVLNQLGVIS